MAVVIWLVFDDTSLVFYVGTTEAAGQDLGGIETRFIVSQGMVLWFYMYLADKVGCKRASCRR
jgi:hypothetical protein